jgi:predicted ester cyclase
MDEVGTLYCRFIDSLNHRALDDLDRFLAARVVQHAPEPAVGEPAVGIDAARQELARWLAAVPDAHLVIEDLVVEGDHLMARLRATGTRRESAVGGAPTGTRVNVAVFEAWSVRDGRCVERWLHVERGACDGPPGTERTQRAADEPSRA